MGLRGMMIFFLPFLAMTILEESPRSTWVNGEAKFIYPTLYCWDTLVMKVNYDFDLPLYDYRIGTGKNEFFLI